MMAMRMFAKLRATPASILTLSIRPDRQDSGPCLSKGRSRYWLKLDHSSLLPAIREKIQEFPPDL